MRMSKCVFESETGTQLLRRLENRKSFHQLDDTLFPVGLEPSSAVEVYGKAGVGKSELLLRLTVNCITPPRWGDHQVGGLGLGAVYLDADHHFSVIRLIRLLESRVKPYSLSEAEAHEFVTECMQRLQVVQCTDSAQMIITLHSIEQFVTSNRDYSLVVVDSISAFYWQDRLTYSSMGQVNAHYRHVADILRKLMNECQVTVLLSRQHLINYGDPSTSVAVQSTHPSTSSAASTVTSTVTARSLFDPDERHFLGRIMQQIPSWQISLSRETETKIVALVKGRGGYSLVKRFRILEDGIQFDDAVS